MTVYEKAPMQQARFNAPLALVRDRFLLALGGFSGRQSPTLSCECYDTLTNHWFSIASLPAETNNGCAVVLERFVYMMPGTQTAANNSLVIKQLDTGSTGQYEGDKHSREYGYVIARQKWVLLNVANRDFTQAQPVAGIKLNPTEMLIFGGDSTKTFQLDTREISTRDRAPQANVKTCQNMMTSVARFGNQSDWVARTFGNFVYCIDAIGMNLHVLTLRDRLWNSQPLTELGVPKQ